MFCLMLFYISCNHFYSSDQDRMPSFTETEIRINQQRTNTKVLRMRGHYRNNQSTKNKHKKSCEYVGITKRSNRWRPNTKVLRMRRHYKNVHARWILVLNRTVNDCIRKSTETQYKYKYKSLITFKVVPLNKWDK